MKHQADYNGTVKGYHDAACPTCGWHIRAPVDGGEIVYLNYGDITALHSWATPGLSMSVQVTQDDPRLRPFERWADGTDDENNY